MINRLLPVFFLAFSGLLITTVSAFFSVQGFLLFIPDPHLMIGILGLGIAFELAKITGSTFLFHKMSDSKFPALFKVILTLAVMALVVFSVIFTFVHLNSSASKSLAGSGVTDTKIVRLQERNASIEKTISDFELQISGMSTNMVSAKMKLYDKFKPEKEKLQKEYNDNVTELHNLQDSTVESDQFVFLSNLSKFTGLEREKIFNVVIMFIVCIIDPLAISLFLASSYILTATKKEEKVVEEVEEELILPKPVEEKPLDLSLLMQTGKNDLYAFSSLPVHQPTTFFFPEKPEPKTVIIEVPVEVQVPYETIKEVEVIKEIIKEVEKPIEVFINVPEPYEVIVEKLVPVEIEIIKEVPVEVIKEVEVPVNIETIKEVEVIKEVEIIKTVEVPVNVEIIKEIEVIKEIETIKEVEIYIDRPVPVKEHVEQYDNSLVLDEYTDKLFYVPKAKMIEEVEEEPALDSSYLEDIDNSNDEELDAAIDKILDGENPLGHRKKLLKK